MHRYLLLVLALLGPPSSLYSQEVSLTLEGGDAKVVKVDQVTIVKVDRTVITKLPFKVHAPSDETYTYKWIVPSGVVVSDQDDILEVTSAPRGDLLVQVRIRAAFVDAGKIKYKTITGSAIYSIGDINPPLPPPDPGPAPKPPEPKPPEPKPPTPQPVSSFRVYIVYESTKTYSAAQISTMDSKVVRDWLTTNTTPDGRWAGWRKYDKDQLADGETPTMKALWEAVQPKLTALPCVAVEVNGSVEIVPLEATPAAMVEMLKKRKAGL